MKRSLSVIIGFVVLSGIIIEAIPKMHHQKKNKRFIPIRMLPVTPIKDQGQSQTCWIYAMLATIETEHISSGDSVHLSEAYAYRSVIRERARMLLHQTHKPTSAQRAMAIDLLPAIYQYGILARDSYCPKNALTDSTLVCHADRLAELAIKEHWDEQSLDRAIVDLLEKQMAPAPQRQYMAGAEYTPQEFVHSVLRKDEYMGVTSDPNHDFYRAFAPDFADNYRHDMFLNIPIDSLTHIIEHSIMEGHPACWEGDTHTDDFSLREGIAMEHDSIETPMEDWRKEKLINGEIKDDHAMAIIGIAKDMKGKRFFVCKNSHGAKNPYKGFIYMSYNYFKRYTTAAVINKKAIKPKGFLSSCATPIFTNMQ